jgi:hypothetical protein
MLAVERLPSLHMRASRRITPMMRAMSAAAPWLLLLAIATASPASADQLCRATGTNDTLRPIPESLVPAATRLFQLDAMPAEQIQRSTYFRCDAGRVLVCNIGANLPCGKANTSRQLPSADAWCAEHPGSDFIPMYVTGHDTIYRWRCSGVRAATIGAPAEVDRRGFIARYWKPADAAPPPSQTGR